MPECINVLRHLQRKTRSFFSLHRDADLFEYDADADADAVAEDDEKQSGSFQWW